MVSNISTLILTALKDKSLYGLEIIKSIQEETNGELTIKQPSLYSALRRLETRGFVTSYWTDSELGGKRHYYTITSNGLDWLKNKLSMREVEKKFIKNKADDLFKNEDTNTDEKNINLKESDSAIKQYSSHEKNEGSFSEVQRAYVYPKNDYPEYQVSNTSKKEESDESVAKIQTDNDSVDKPLPDFDHKEYNEEPSSDVQKDNDSLFPNVDNSLEFEDILNEDIEEDNLFQGEEINYKDILGDLYLDEDKVDSIDNTPNPTPEKDKDHSEYQYMQEDNARVLNKGHEYARHFESILTGKDDSPKSEPLNPASIKLLEEISKRHKKNLESKEKIVTEQLESRRANPNEEEEFNQDILKQVKIKRNSPTPHKRETKYILINKLKNTAHIILFSIMLVEIAIFFAVYGILNWLGLEQYLLFGSALFLILFIFLINAVQYKKYPDKKIRKKINWGLKLVYIIIATFLLIVFTISINLLIGMNDFFQYDYLLRWLLPCTLFLNIITIWVINLLISRNEKYKL